MVVQGIPWKFADEDLMALFEGAGAVEEAKVVIGKDGRSRVRARLPVLAWCAGGRVHAWGRGWVGVSQVCPARWACRYVHA